MLGDFITRILVLALGYAYPAYECFKTVEKNRVGIEELRFWCQYWIIVALVTVFERIGDIFVSWLPMYGEMKLALFIYLWYPKTKGTGYVYGTILKPYLAKHEKDIDQNLQEFRARSWDLIIFYAQNGAQLGQATVFQILDYMSSHVGKLRQPSLQKVEDKGNSPSPPSPQESGIFKRHKQPSDKRRPPIPPPSPTYSHRSVAHPTKPDSVQINLHEQTKFISSEDILVHQDVESSSTENPDQQNNGLNLARLKLRRTKSIH